MPFLHPLHLASRRLSDTTLTRRHPGAQVIDVTSKGPAPWVRFSPFYPHGDIPVPLSPSGRVGASVEGIWQALKVFEASDVDPGKLENRTMRNLKRTTRLHGRVLGHRAGFGALALLAYGEARRAIYLPAYRWVLEHRLQAELAQLRALASEGPLVLLDYETNADIDDLSKPLSHAALVIAWLQGAWPNEPAG